MSNLEFSVLTEPPATDADECCRQLAAAVRQGGRASCSGGPSNFTVSCALDDVAAVASIRNAVLSGAYDRRASDATRRRVRADRACFVEALERKRAEDAEQLTPHQRQVLENLPETGDVHLRAPAGAGKTHWGLHRAHAEIERGANVLFCARNEALALFACRWIYRRSGDAGLERFFVLVDPFAEGPRRARREGDVLRLVSDATASFSLIVVDEAHHVYAEDSRRKAVESCVSTQTRRVLLSDASQGASAVAYPPAHAAELTEVVRCSQRVVAGAMAFQLGGDRKLLTASVSEDAGPPLKSFLFDVEDNRFEAYGKYCQAALAHVSTSFPGLDLHDRVCVAVPSDEFRRRLLETGAFDSYRVRTAAGASAELVGASLVVDAIDNLDGLERLVVICCGLDAVKDETRSSLYRAVTRAHLMVVVVNEFLRGGWLEFLGSVRLKEERFDARDALERCRLSAADDAVGADVSAAVEARLSSTCPSAVVAELRRAALHGLEAGAASADAAAQSAVDAWASEVAAAAAALGALGVVDEELAATVALALRKRQEVTLDGAAARAVAKRRAERRAVDARALLPPDASEPARRFVVARFVHSKAPIAAEAVRARCEEYQNIAATVAHRAAQLAADRSGPKGPPVDAEALAAATLERVAKLATAEVPALSVESAFAEALAAADAAAVSNHIGDAVRKALEPKPGGWIFAAARGEPRLGAAARKALVESFRPPRADWPGDPRVNDDWPAWTRSVDKAADEEAGRWAKAEALALYALDEALREAGLDDQPDLAETLVREAFFRGHREPETLVADVKERAAALVAERKEEGESCERHLARVALALKEACDARNLRPSLIAADALRKKVLTAWRNGQDLQEAAAAAARQYENSDRNDAVPQTVWDPSGNRTAQASAMVKFMPFRSASQCHAIGDDAFSYVYTFLHFSLLGTVALVCKRWRAASQDPFWLPDVVCYAWGRAGVSGLEQDAPKPTLLDFSIARSITKVVCGDEATFAVCDDGTLYHWGKRWEPDFERPVLEASREMTMTPTKVAGLSDVVQVACTPSGYYHGRGRAFGYTVAALTSSGKLYTWGMNVCGQTLHARNTASRNPADYFVSNPREVVFGDGERTLKVAVGLEFIAVQRTSGTSSRVSWAGRFSDGHLRNTDARPSDLRAVSELDGMKLASLTAGAFHCCALRDEGSLYVFGDEYGADESNGNLLGLGPRNETSVTPGPRWHRATRVEGLPPVTSVAASTYSTVAIATDGRCYSWGDCDGGALGRSSANNDAPGLLDALKGVRACAGALSYTNGAVASAQGRVYLCGNQPVRQVRFFTKSFLGDDAADLARSSGEEPTWPRHRTRRKILISTQGSTSGAAARGKEASATRTARTCRKFPGPACRPATRAAAFRWGTSTGFWCLRRGCAAAPSVL